MQNTTVRAERLNSRAESVNLLIYTIHGKIKTLQILKEIMAKDK